MEITQVGKFHFGWFFLLSLKFRYFKSFYMVYLIQDDLKQAETTVDLDYLEIYLILMIVLTKS